MVNTGTDIVRLTEALPPALRDEMTAFARCLQTGRAYEPTEPGVGELALRWADKLRKQMLRTRDDPRRVEDWLRNLKGSLPVAHGMDPVSVTRSVILICANLPAEVWSNETLAAALSQMEWFPTPGALAAFLAPYASRIERPIKVLEIIGQPRAREGAPYAIPPAPTYETIPARPSPHAPVRSVAEQLASLLHGETRPNAA